MRLSSHPGQPDSLSRGRRSIWPWAVGAIVLGLMAGSLIAAWGIEGRLRAPGLESRALLERSGWSLPQATLLARRARELDALPSFRTQPDQALEQYARALSEGQSAMRRAGIYLPDVPALAAAADAREVGVPLDEIVGILAESPRSVRSARVTAAFFAYTASRRPVSGDVGGIGTRPGGANSEIGGERANAGSGGS